MIKYKEIIEQLDIEEAKIIIEGLGIPILNETDDYLILPTVCHNISDEDNSGKLYFYKNTKVFMCYTCCGAMSFFTFLKKFYEVRKIPYNWHRDILEVLQGKSSMGGGGSNGFEGIYKSKKEKYIQKKNRKLLPEYDVNILNLYEEAYPQIWVDDGISKETMKKYGILYSQSYDRIIIPHRDLDGRLIGIRSRNLSQWEIEKVGKYMPLRVEGRYYSHPLSLNVYGLGENKENIRNRGICFIGESEKFVLQMESFSGVNCGVSTCGSNLNKYQVDLIIRAAAPREMVICYDREDNLNNKYFYKLWDMCNKYKNYCKISFICDLEKKLSLKDSPTDKGEEIFNQLVEKRVKVN